MLLAAHHFDRSILHFGVVVKSWFFLYSPNVLVVASRQT